jgi:diaminohydroxyphosphoribosylaminopyrimidine deaminase/5-amino-6-(5-phosphoribosylamino)uracil reductase
MTQRVDDRARDAAFMHRAIELGRRGLGRTSPNPPVGALVVRGNQVIGSGWHHRAGLRHAEVIALDRAGEAARGATLYLTLEPCSHQGRTPPCAPRVVAAGIERVVVGAVDPNPRVRGRGLRLLAKAGVKVEIGVEAEAARELIRCFAHFIRTGLPFVRLKLAASADGRIATGGGESRWITGPLARRLVHRWRNEHDAVMVGVTTVLVDDPRLTCRIAGGRDPLRVVVDSRLRTPAEAALLATGKSRVLIATTRRHDVRRARELTARGVEILVLPSAGGRVSLGALFRALGKRGIVSVMVEGGARLAASLVVGGHVDELAWFTAPLLIGGDGSPMIGPLGVRWMARAVRLRGYSTRRVGRDLLHFAVPSRTERARRRDG